MINRRAAQMTLDAAAGKTYADIAAEHGIGVARVGQIITDARGQLGLTRTTVTKEELGCALARRREAEPDYPRGCTPRAFYFDEIVRNLPVPSDIYY